MAIQWALWLHIASVLVFLAAHGASMVVLYRIRRERDRQKILSFITLSGETARPMYIALGAIVISGVYLGWRLASFRHWWIWTAIAILVLTNVLMVAVAKPYFDRVKGACAMRPSGVPRKSDEELIGLLTSPRAHVITAIGVAGLAVILYLMVFQPGLL
ncbi:MAG: hypothetical protein QOE83_1806 [Actinomycetota bacterium]|nr:hypothetical protein [Actinomycetota bacterium]